MQARLGKIHLAGFSYLRATGLWASVPYVVFAGDAQSLVRWLPPSLQASKKIQKEKTSKTEVIVFCNLVTEITPHHCCHNHFALRKRKGN